MAALVAVASIPVYFVKQATIFKAMELVLYVVLGFSGAKFVQVWPVRAAKQTIFKILLPFLKTVCCATAS